MTQRGGRTTNLRTAATLVVRRLRAAGFEALFAGGCVRDLLMRRCPSDYDVATGALPDRVVQLFRRTREVGRQFGVVLVRVQGHWIEVATFRTDASYRDGRRPERVHFATAQEDAQRRDFTINGMFYDPVARRVIDYVGGQADLARRVIRAIGEPQQRFAEDHLRLLRAVRFAARLGFQIEPKTWAAMRACAPLLRRVSAERVHEELERMLESPTRATAWSMLVDSGLVEHLWDDSPSLVARQAEIRDTLAALPRDATVEMALAALVLPSVPAAERMCKSLRTSNDRLRRVCWLVDRQCAIEAPESLSLADLKRLMADPGFPELAALFRARLKAAGMPEAPWRTLRARAAAIPAKEVAPPPLLTGHDLMALGAAAGPRFGEILARVYDAQLNGTVTDRAAARAEARRLLTRTGRAPTMPQSRIQRRSKP